MKKKSIVIIILFFILLLGMFLFKRVLSSFYDEKIEIDDITITDFEIVETDNFYNDYFIMKIGDTFTPTINFLPTTISQYQKKIAWTISDASKLSIDFNNTFNAKEVGIVEVTGTAVKNYEIKKTIKIKIIESENSFEFGRGLLAQMPVFSVGEIAYLDHSISGPISLGDITWESSNEKVATIDNGYLKGISIGYTTIKATSSIDKEFSVSLDVKISGKNSIEKVSSVVFSDIIGVTVNGYNNNLKLDNFKYEKMHVSYIVELFAATNIKNAKDVYFIFEDPSMVKVLKKDNSSVQFELLKTGLLKVYAVSSYFPEVKECFEFNVYPFDLRNDFKLISPSKSEMIIENENTILELNYGEIKRLKLESNGIGLDFSNIVGKSSDESVAIIKNGYIYAIKNGESLISIYYNNNEENLIKFYVRVSENKNDYFPTELINVDYAMIDDEREISTWDKNFVYVNSRFTIRLSLYPLYSNNNLYDIVLSNPDVCSINTSIIDNILEIEGTFLNIGYTQLNIVNVENNKLNYFLDFQVNNSRNVSFECSKIPILERGQTGNCNVVLSDGLKGVDVSYTSSDPSIVSVGHAGEMVGLGYGNATITVYATDGVSSHTESFEVECVKEHSLYDALKTFKSVVKMDNKEISLSEKLMYIGDSFTIDVSFTPSNHPFGKYHEVKVEKPDILSVDKNNNKYTFNCLKSGTTKVIVYPYANPDFSIEYTVTIANIMPEFMFVSIPDKVMYVEDRYQFGYLVDWRATYSKVDVIIGDESIVEIVDDYLVIKNPGKTYVSFVIDDNDDNTVSYVQTLEIEAFEHSNGVKLERYGYGNFIVRIISQVLCALIIGILGSVIASYKPFKTSQILNDVLVMGILLIVLILCNVVRISITSLKYEKYDLLISVSSYLVGLVIGFIVNVIKKRKGDVNNA